MHMESQIKKAIYKQRPERRRELLLNTLYSGKDWQVVDKLLIVYIYLYPVVTLLLCAI